MSSPDVNELVEKIANFFKKSKGLDLNQIDIISLLKSDRTKRLKKFESLSFSLKDVDEDLAQNIIKLEIKKLVYQDKASPNTYVPTLKLLLYYKYNLPLENKFLNEIDEEFFQILYEDKKMPLNGDEKAIIIALLGLLAFDKNSSVRIISDSVSQVFKECVEDAATFLKNHSYNDKTLENIWSVKAREEDPVQAKLARIDKITRKTNNIYSKDKKSGHYLDILYKNEIDSKKLNMLLSKIFDKGTLSYEDRSEFLKLLDKIYEKRTKIITQAEAGFDLLSIKIDLKEKIKEWSPYV